MDEEQHETSPDAVDNAALRKIYDSITVLQADLEEFAPASRTVATTKTSAEIAARARALALVATKLEEARFWMLNARRNVRRG